MQCCVRAHVKTAQYDVSMSPKSEFCVRTTRNQEECRIVCVHMIRQRKLTFCEDIRDTSILCIISLDGHLCVHIIDATTAQDDLWSRRPRIINLVCITCLENPLCSLRTYDRRSDSTRRLLVSTFIKNQPCASVHLKVICVCT